MEATVARIKYAHKLKPTRRKTHQPKKGERIMERITPQTELPIGTRVRVKNRRGHIVKAEYAPAHPTGYIYVHVVRYTEKMAGRHGQTERWKPIKPVEERCNYSFIQVYP
jgi:hypothetical protein